MAIVQLRNDTEGRRYFARKKAAGKSSMEALRCLERRSPDVVYRQVVADAAAKSADQEAPTSATPDLVDEAPETGPGGHVGATPDSSAASSYPDAGPSEQSLPGPADPIVTSPPTTRKTPSST